MEFLKFGVESVKVRLDPFPPGNSRLFIFVYLEGLYVPNFSSFCLRCIFSMWKYKIILKFLNTSRPYLLESKTMNYL